MRHRESQRPDVDAGVATRTIADCEQGVSHITQPYRYNGTPDRGTSVLLCGAGPYRAAARLRV